MYFPSLYGKPQLVSRTAWRPAALAVTSLDAAAGRNFPQVCCCDTIEQRKNHVGGKNRMFIAKWAPLILLLSLPGHTAARQSQPGTPPASDQQQDSLAAAARRAREAKKDQAKPTKVWDNESVASATGAISIVGQPAAPANNPAPEAVTKSPAGNPPTADKSAIEADLNAAKANLQSLKVDLDLLQRKYALDQQTYYGTPEYSSDTAGATALANEKSQVDSKQQEITDAEKKVADLQAQLDAANKSSSSAH
jgi:hypothetical protein